MAASIEERSVWVQLVALVVALGAYFVVAGSLLRRGVTELPAYAAIFAVAVIFLVLLLIAGHIVAAISGRVEARDERDRLIEWKAESRSSWILGVGVLGSVTAMLLGVDQVWIANMLLLSLALSTLLELTLRVVFYRRGV